MSEMSLARKFGRPETASIFIETADYAKEMKDMGESAEKTSVRAFKEKVLIANGAFCRARWKL